MTYHRFLEMCQRRIAYKHASVRAGQIAFTVLYECNPKLAARLLNLAENVADPYYLDENLPGFFEWVANNWNNNK